MSFLQEVLDLVRMSIKGVMYEERNEMVKKMNEIQAKMDNSVHSNGAYLLMILFGTPECRIISMNKLYTNLEINQFEKHLNELPTDLLLNFWTRTLPTAVSRISKLLEHVHKLVPVMSFQGSHSIFPYVLRLNNPMLINLFIKAQNEKSLKQCLAIVAQLQARDRVLPIIIAKDPTLITLLQFKDHNMDLLAGILSSLEVRNLPKEFISNIAEKFMMNANFLEAKFYDAFVGYLMRTRLINDCSSLHVVCKKLLANIPGLSNKLRSSITYDSPYYAICSLIDKLNSNLICDFVVHIFETRNMKAVRYLMDVYKAEKEDLDGIARLVSTVLCAFIGIGEFDLDFISTVKDSQIFFFPTRVIHSLLSRDKELLNQFVTFHPLVKAVTQILNGEIQNLEQTPPNTIITACSIICATEYPFNIDHVEKIDKYLSKQKIPSNVDEIYAKKRSIKKSIPLWKSHSIYTVDSVEIRRLLAGISLKQVSIKSDPVPVPVLVPKPISGKKKPPVMLRPSEFVMKETSAKTKGSEDFAMMFKSTALARCEENDSEEDSEEDSNEDELVLSLPKGSSRSFW